jgi:hypothetical protein
MASAVLEVFGHDLQGADFLAVTAARVPVSLMIESVFGKKGTMPSDF